MAKPYLIFKAHTGFYYAQIRLADESLSNNKFNGCKNRAEAERKVIDIALKTISKTCRNCLAITTFLWNGL